MEIKIVESPNLLFAAYLGGQFAKYSGLLGGLAGLLTDDHKFIRIGFGTLSYIIGSAVSMSAEKIILVEMISESNKLESEVERSAPKTEG